jgi:predicted PhzF superfamily epimerase YddE/YHI9
MDVFITILTHGKQTTDNVFTISFQGMQKIAREFNFGETTFVLWVEMPVAPGRTAS